MSARLLRRLRKFGVFGHSIGGSDLRLLADKILVFPRLDAIGHRFVWEVEAFLKVVRIKPHLFVETAMGDAGLVLWVSVARPPAFCTLKRVHTVMPAHSSDAQHEAVRAAEDHGVSMDTTEEE